jgi:glyoxylate/hydroxypyruvate reductase A
VTSILFAHDPKSAGPWRSVFQENAPDISFNVWEEGTDCPETDYLITWKPPAGLISRLPRLRGIFLLSAGVDHLALPDIPRGVDLFRMSEPGLVNGMVEYVTFAVLGIHRGMFRYARQQASHSWKRDRDAASPVTRIGVMGLGALGSAVVASLRSQGFAVSGWSRTKREIAGVPTYCGREGLGDFLPGADILISLVALTPQTRGLVDASMLAQLPRGAAFVNVARGDVVNENDLLAALASGQIGQAVLDVFATEPLPPDHPFWSHPNVFVTPHVASVFQPETAAMAVLENLRAHLAGARPAAIVDHDRGY